MKYQLVFFFLFNLLTKVELDLSRIYKTRIFDNNIAATAPSQVKAVDSEQRGSIHRKIPIVIRFNAAWTKTAAGP